MKSSNDMKGGIGIPTDSSSNKNNGACLFLFYFESQSRMTIREDGGSSKQGDAKPLPSSVITLLEVGRTSESEAS